MASNRKRVETPSSSPSELVRLDSVSMDEDDEILPDFEAEVDGRRVWVTAVLERTAVVEPAPGEPKVLVNRRRLMVNPGHLRVRHLASKEAARRGREAVRQLGMQGHTYAASASGFPLQPALRSEETLRSGKIRFCPNCGIFYLCVSKPPTSPR